MGYTHEFVKERLEGLTNLGVTRIGAGEALARWRNGEPIAFVDARREKEWRRAHEKLPGAKRMAPDQADETLPIIRPGRSAIVYCTSPAEFSSVAAAQVLRLCGYQDVHVLQG